MKRLLVVLVAVLLVATVVPAASAQGEFKDLDVKIEAPGVRYPGEWFDVTVKVTNSNHVDTYFSVIVWLEKPAWGGEYKLLQVGSNTGVGERCDSSRCVFAWSGSIGWEQYKLLTVHVQAGSEIGKHRLVRVELTQFPPLFPSRIDKEAYLTIVSPPEGTTLEATTPPSVVEPAPAPMATAKLYVERRSPWLDGRFVSIRLVLHSEKDTWFTGTISSSCGIKAIDFVSDVGTDFTYVWSTEIPKGVGKCTVGGPVYAKLLLLQFVGEPTYTYEVPD